jgi:hypothetical protein
LLSAVRLFPQEYLALGILSGGKTFSPSGSQGRSLLPLSPKRIQVSLKSLLYLVRLMPDSLSNPRTSFVARVPSAAKRPTPNAARRCPQSKSSTALFAPAASFHRSHCFAFDQKIWHTIFFSRKRTSKYSRSCSVSEKLARYISSPLSNVEHLSLLVGKGSVALDLIRDFGSLKTMARASFQELRQFLSRRQAESVVAALSMSLVAETEHARSEQLDNPESIYRACANMKLSNQKGSAGYCGA